MPLKLPKPLQAFPFSLRQARQAGMTFYEIKKLIQTGEIEQLARGIYRVPQPDFSEEDQFRAAILQVDYPSAVCLVSALIFYGLTDLIGKKVWILVPNSKRIHSKEIRLIRVRDPQWTIGIKQEQGYWITTIERTLVESLVYRRIIGTNTGVEALKRATQQKKTSLGLVLEMAVKLKVDHRILPYIEALLS